ncbi:unnamed protein product [Cylindrotheca closterium]|uniref:Uncharacterized protein n=1 Tax=Cylindrotheca closterium TaxID=2856 RepID=A0AAD2CSQ1_9STRA|nr:unnamed protein product [Cylindrotheca closterium]
MTMTTKKTTNPKRFRIGFEIIFLFISSLFLVLLFLQKQYFFKAAFPPPIPTSKQNDPSILLHSRSNISTTRRQYIDVESKSVIAHDIQAIWHDPSMKAICIQFTMGNARCPHAEFIGRLSGPSLVMLEWKEYNRVDGDNTILHCGSYSNALLSPSSSLESKNNHDDDDHNHDGTQYFVEILILYCQHFGVGSKLYQKSQQSINATSTPQTDNEWLTFAFQNMCVEKPEANRITPVGSSIRISSSKQATVIGNRDTVGGRWIHDQAATMRPLVTRYQPQGCRRSNTNITFTNAARTTEEKPQCQVATNTARFGDYKFEWSHNGQEEESSMKKNIENLQWDIGLTRQQVCGDGLSTGDQKRDCILRLGKILQNSTLLASPPTPPSHDESVQKSGSFFQTPPPLQQRPSKVVCVVGYSHSYHMIYAMHQLNLGHHFVWAQANYPNDIDFHFVRRHVQEHKCNRFLIGVGQWPASHWGNQNNWPEGKPVPFGVYRNEIFRVLDMFHNHFSKIKVYMRSIHHNPIMEDSGKCLAGDWRTPTVMTAYSEIIREQVHNLNERILQEAAPTTTDKKQYQKDPQIQFLDTRFITYPMWDSSYDWYHLSDQVAKVEAQYIAATILDSKSKQYLLGPSSED